MTTFRNRLRELRQRKSMTQEALAEALNVKKSTISMYENGYREPDHEMLEQIADYFNVDIDYLMGRSNMITRIEKIDMDTQAIIDGVKRLAPKDKEYVTELVRRLGGK